jgi:hypothetical protein
VTEKGVATRPVSTKEVADRGLKGSQYGPQAEVEAKHHGATRPADPQATPSGAATPPRHGPPPSTATEARQEVERMLDASEPTPHPDRPSRAKDGRKAR